MLEGGGGGRRRQSPELASDKRGSDHQCCPLAVRAAIASHGAAKLLSPSPHGLRGVAGMGDCWRPKAS